MSSAQPRTMRRADQCRHPVLRHSVKRALIVHGALLATPTGAAS